MNCTKLCFFFVDSGLAVSQGLGIGIFTKTLAYFRTFSSAYSEGKKLRKTMPVICKYTAKNFIRKHIIELFHV